MSDGAIDTMLEFHAKAHRGEPWWLSSTMAMAAFSRVDADATAFGDRSWPYNIVGTALWTNAAESEANIRWTRDCWQAMQPFLADTAYVNYLGDINEEPGQLMDKNMNDWPR